MHKPHFCLPTDSCNDLLQEILSVRKVPKTTYLITSAFQDPVRVRGGGQGVGTCPIRVGVDDEEVAAVRAILVESKASSEDEGSKYKSDQLHDGRALRKL